MAEVSADPSTTHSGSRELVLLSCLMLFLELALIRLVAAHNVYVRYFTNFVLLASFLGIGLGFLRANTRRDPFWSLPFFLLLSIAFVMLFPWDSGAAPRTAHSACRRSLCGSLCH